MNFGDPDEFTTIPSDAPIMEKIAGPEEPDLQEGEGDSDPYVPPEEEEEEPPEEYDEEYESSGKEEIDEAGDGEEDDENEATGENVDVDGQLAKKKQAK